MDPISIVMIAYNEEKHIGRVLREYHDSILKRMPGSEMILYLDKPTDATGRIALGLDLDIRIVEGIRNLGYAGAMRKAIGEAKNSIIFFSDTSGKHRASDFWKMIRHIPEFDIVTGKRSYRTDPLPRRMASFIQRIFVSVFFFMPFFDSNSGYKIIKNGVIDIALKECRYLDKSFSTELIVRAVKRGFRVKEVPVLFRNRPGKNTGTTVMMLPGIIIDSLKRYYRLRADLWRR